MRSSKPPVVRHRTPNDVQSENAVRGPWVSGRAQKHQHWPRPPKESTVTLLGELGGQVVGRCLSEAAYPPFGELQNMNVALPFRGRGVGSAMVDACVEELTSRGCMAMFLQTDTDNATAHRLYVRKGFFPVARGAMLRLVRFIDLPLRDEFMHTHPLSIYVPPEGNEGCRWPLRWVDWTSGEELTVILTSGSSDRDSDDYGPGLAEVALRSEVQSFRASLDGPPSADNGQTIQLAFALVNEGDKLLKYSTRWLLPPGMDPTGQWDRRGPQGKLEPGETSCASLDVRATPKTDSQALDGPSGVSFPSLPLTLEVYIGPTSFWLTHQMMIPNLSRGEQSDR